MGLPKGRTNNKKGRKPGALNTISAPFRQRIVTWLEDNFDNILKKIEKLDDEKQVKAYQEFMKYGIAALSSTHEFLNLSPDQMQQIVEKLKEQLSQNEERQKKR